jgi:membrane-bound lytic murein transglycosylase D
MIRKYILGLLIVFSLCIEAHAERDLWQVLRQSFKLRDQSSQPEVKAQIRYLKAHPAYFNAFAKNSKRYIYYILETIKSQRLPGELALLPMIESNYNPFAYSKAGAAGLWQLMPGTGSGLGVKQDWWYDGRRGIMNSTRAALSYLQYLNRFFGGNWILSFAAYDSGEGTVQRAILRNQRERKSTRFWSLPLPRETQAYLPRLLAFVSIIKYPKYFGMTLPRESYGPAFQEIEVGSQIDLTHAAKLANITYADMLKLNPGHNRWATAPSKTQTLLLPIDKVALFKKNLTTLPKSERVAWARHKVAAGETLGLIAQKEKSSLPLIKEVNHLKSNVIIEGQTLLIPASKNLSHHNLTEAKKQSAIHQSNYIGPHRVIHVIQKNDTPQKLSRKYHVKAGEIAFWNQLKPGTPLKTGEKLILWQKKPSRFTYRVKKGDSLSKIAARFHISQQRIKQWNPTLKNKPFLIINQKLIVYS